MDQEVIEALEKFFEIYDRDGPAAAVRWVEEKTGESILGLESVPTPDPDAPSG